MSVSPNTASSTAGALNNMAIDLLRCCAWNEAVETLHKAICLMKYDDDDADDHHHKENLDYFRSLLRATEDQVQYFRSLGPSQRPRPACSRENLSPVLIHSQGDEMSTETKSSMIIYNYALALDCAGATEEAVYRLLQISSALLPRDRVHSYHSFHLRLAEQLLDSAQRLGLQQDCIEHCATIEEIVQWAREFNCLMHAPSASAA